MFRAFASVSALALMAGVATAADLPAPMSAPAPIYNPAPMAYTWTGFYVGAHAGYGFGDGDIEDGALVGLQAGYNWQFNQFVLGAEGDATWTDWGSTDSTATLRLRAGFAIDRLLAYGTGGVAFQDFDDTGWVAGAGVEYAMTNNLSLGLEYLHYNFDGDDSNVVRGRVSYKFGY